MDEYKTEGVVEFTLMGQTLRLRPFTTRPKRFYFVFRDASGGQETYETARFLYADLLDDGTTVLDFNQAYNPPCAFNPYTTCPIPLRGESPAGEGARGRKGVSGQGETGQVVGRSGLRSAEPRCRVCPSRGAVARGTVRRADWMPPEGCL